MYEFEILLENGSTDNISGYSYEDALFRSRRKPEEVVKVLNREYEIFLPKWEEFLFQFKIYCSAGRA